jgi:hypothetical protein
MTKDGRGRLYFHLPTSPRTQSGCGTGILFRTPRKRPHEHQTVSNKKTMPKRSILLKSRLTFLTSAHILLDEIFLGIKLGF